MLKLALVCLLSLAGCSDPCSDEARAAFIAIGGPVGALVAALEQCGSIQPAPPVPTEQQPPDMGAAHADLATNPADMAQQPAPDLSPVTQVLFMQDQFFWAYENSAQRTGASVTTQAAFDFASGKPVYAGITIPVYPLNTSPNNYKMYELSASLNFDVAWGAYDATFCPTVGQPSTYLVKSGTNQTCVSRYVGFQFYVDGVLQYSISAPAGARMAFSLPSPLPVLPGQALSYRVLVNGDAVLSSFVADVRVLQRY